MSNYVWSRKVNPWGGAVRSPDDLQALLEDQAAGASRSPAGELIAPAAMKTPKGSGMTSKGVANEDQKKMVDELRTLIMDPDQIKTSMKALSDVPEIRAQREGQERMQALLDMEMARQPQAGWKQLDLTPLADLTRYVTKGQYQSTYKPPVSQREKLLAFAEKLQDNQRDLAKSMLEGLGKIKSGTSREQFIEQLMRKVENTNQDPQIAENRARGQGLAQQGQYDRELRQDLDKDIGMIMNTRAEQFNNIDTAFKSGDYAQIMPILSQFARGIANEKGVLTDKDRDILIPKNFQGDFAKFVAYFNKTPSAEVPPEYTASLRKMIATAKANARNMYKKMLETKKGAYRPSPYYNEGTEQVFNHYGKQIDTVLPEEQKELSFEERIKRFQAAKAGAQKGGK